VNTIGLTQGLVKLGHNAVAALREPSLGPVFGMKGGATGGGKASVEPLDKINLHFNGDFHAITAAHNLLAALIDTHLHFGNDLRLDPKEILWPRAMDMNDRALRRLATGLGGRDSGPARETGLRHHRRVRDHGDPDARREPRRPAAPPVADRRGLQLRREGRDRRDLKAVGPMMVLLNEAILPNLVQTTEGAPAIVHCGPFANIAHGTSSVLAQRCPTHGRLRRE
jgi:formate--tetrahydrofolate ligase